MTSIVFPGQGSQTSGMVKDFYDNFEIARGLSNYSNRQANQLKGKKSASFASIVGFQGRAELIHADDLVMMEIKRENNEST